MNIKEGGITISSPIIIKDMPYQAKTSRVAIGLGCSHR